MTRPLTANRDFQGALAALQAGKLNDAERLFKSVLRAEPKHVGALNLMGAVLTQSKRFAEAENYFRRALQQHAQSDVTLYNYGIVLKALKRPAEAVQRFDEALKINSSVAETWNNRGTALNDLKRHEEAIADFDKAIALNPRYAEAFHNKGKSLIVLGRGDKALIAFDRALAINSNVAEAWLGRGSVLFERKEYQSALAAFDRAIALKPDLVEAWLGRGNLLFELNRCADALVAFERALVLKPDLAQAWLGSGKALFRSRRYNEAFVAYEHALRLDCDLAEAWLGRGTVSFEQKEFDAALTDFKKALALKPDFASAWLGVGNVHLGQKRYEEASSAYDHAQTLQPNFAEAWLCRGNLSLALKQFGDALAAYEKARQLKPELAEAWSGLGMVLHPLERFVDALEAFDRALDIKPDLADAWVGHGNVCFSLQQYRDALAAYDRALEIKPDLVEAWFNRATVALYLMQYEQAFLGFSKALTLQPDTDYAEGYRLAVKLYLCDWTDLKADTARLLSHLREGKTVAMPFTLLPLPSTAADQLQCAERFVKQWTVHPPICRFRPYSHDRIRIAYLSADFRDHAVGLLAAGMFEKHDKSRFEITGISFVQARDTVIGSRVANAFERFDEVKGKTDEELAHLIRDLEIDIAIDLMGHTQHARLGVFAHRPAPIQVFYLGFAATLGTNFVDYILADSTVIPDGHREFFTERVVWLPDSYLVADDRRLIADQTPTRRECGLPENGFVYCSFNNSYKIVPPMFQLWMRLLQATPGSVLWLSEAHPIAMANLRCETERCGVSAHRLVFAPKVRDNADHLARQRLADLFLDTLPYNAHTTASDALWAGLPVLTYLGETFAGRVAASLLKAIGVPELITTSLEDYEALALKLAREASFLAAIRAKLARNRDIYPLFDTARFTRHVEAAYTTMWERQQRGERPEAFAVKPMT